MRKLVGLMAMFALSGGAMADRVVPDGKYAIHEWGVFTAPRGALWLQHDMLAEWRSFPEFFHGVLPGRKLLYRGPVRKPVIHFHGESSEPVNLTLQFSAGRPLIWWPPAEYPANGLGDPIREGSSMLNFRVNLGKNEAKQETVSEGHWVEELRKVKAASLWGHGSWGRRGGRTGPWTETFIYYDGLMKLPTTPQVERSEKGVLVTSDSDHAWHDVLVIDRSVDGKEISIGKIARVDKGKQRVPVALTRIGEKELAALAAELGGQLTKAGLHEDEAQSLLALWSKDLFHQVGLSLCYRLPRETYDKWISLTAAPAPDKVVRVGLVLHQHLEPEFEDVVASLVDQLGAATVKERNGAEEQLHRIGGAALPVLEKTAKSDNPERAVRARRILQSVKAGEELLKLMERHQEHLPKKK